MDKQVIYLIDQVINFPWGGTTDEFVFSERLGEYVPWLKLQALEEKVEEWVKEHPLVWNVGIGSAASFVRTLSRLLFERIKDLYEPYDHIVHVRLTPTVAKDSSTAQHWLAFEALIEMARTLKLPLLDHELQELKQLATEECYYGYGTISDYLMIKAFGREYFSVFGSDLSVMLDPSIVRAGARSPILERIRETLAGKRHLLLVENLHVPVSMDVLVFIMGMRRPSAFLNRRWLISTTSKDVCERSRGTSRGLIGWSWDSFHLTPEYYHAPPYDDLRERDWAVLIKEALQDAACSMHNRLKLQQQDKESWFYFRVVQRCMYYAILYHPLQGAAGRQPSNTSSITSDELVRCWVAEDLLFSITNPTNGKKQSNCYRSAYEAGKVIIQELQEYSLLPIYSISTPTISTSSKESASASSPHDTVTGVSKIAEGIPQLIQDELVGHENSDQLRWVSFMNDDGRHVTFDSMEEREFIPREMNMSTLILRGFSSISDFPFDKVLNSNLRVLDLSYTLIESLSSGFSQLLNLHLLSLRGCSKIKTLSPQPPTSDKETSPLARLENLQVLDMNGVPLLKLTQQDGSNKSNLIYLDLSGSKFTTYPSEFFHGMASLEELILCRCTKLKELPPSMAELSNLLVLHVEGTQITSFPEDTFKAMHRLHTLKLINNMLLASLPLSISEAKSLKELHISRCVSLNLHSIWELLSFLEDIYIQTWEALQILKIHGHPNLKNFSLSGPWIRCLSLRGCSRLKSVHFSDDINALEDVDLSGTAIEEIPHNLPNLPQLRMLLLLNVPCFKRFPWNQLVRFPEVFCLDHRAGAHNQFSKLSSQQEFHAAVNQNREETTNTARISINDPRMFHSFNADVAFKLVKEGQFLKSFFVQVKPCCVGGIGPNNKQGEICAKIQRQSPYIDVHSSEAASIVPMMKLQSKQRHVEITANSRYPHGLRHLLAVTESLFITHDSFIRCLTEINYIMMCLEECQLIHCHEMKVVFMMHSGGTEAIDYFQNQKIQISEVLPILKILQVSHSNNLLILIEPGDMSYSMSITLKLLKHIHLEHCPRLEKIFPCSLSLPALETLVVLFCSNLKTIFYNQHKKEAIFDPQRFYEVASSPLPNIKRIYLQELPQLQYYHDDVMFQFETPKWEKLFVRGCHSFHHLPLLKSEHQKSKVVVRGERDWWGRLQWSHPEHCNYYLHVPPPEFVSCKKHIIRSYLR